MSIECSKIIGSSDGITPYTHKINHIHGTLIFISTIDYGEVKFLDGISIGTDMIIGGIGHRTIHSIIGVIGTMDGSDMVTLITMDTDTILIDGIIQVIGMMETGSDITKVLHITSIEKIKTSHIT